MTCASSEDPFIKSYTLIYLLDNDSCLIGFTSHTHARGNILRLSYAWGLVEAEHLLYFVAVRRVSFGHMRYALHCMYTQELAAVIFGYWPSIRGVTVVCQAIEWSCVYATLPCTKRRGPEPIPVSCTTYLRRLALSVFLYCAHKGIRTRRACQATFPVRTQVYRLIKKPRLKGWMNEQELGALLSHYTTHYRVVSYNGDTTIPGKELKLKPSGSSYGSTHPTSTPLSKLWPDPP